MNQLEKEYLLSKGALVGFVCAPILYHCGVSYMQIRY